MRPTRLFAAVTRSSVPIAGRPCFFSSIAFPPPPLPLPPRTTDEALFASVRFLAGEDAGGAPSAPASLQRLDHVSLWEVMRLLKLEEEMRGVAGYPQLDAARLLAHARELLAALRWGPDGEGEGGSGGGGPPPP